MSGVHNLDILAARRRCFISNLNLYESKYPYSYDSFYAASPDMECDLFRCVENGKLYLPCENDLQEYMGSPQKKEKQGA